MGSRPGSPPDPGARTPGSPRARRAAARRASSSTTSSARGIFVLPALAARPARPRRGAGVSRLRRHCRPDGAVLRRGGQPRRRHRGARTPMPRRRSARTSAFIVGALNLLSAVLATGAVSGMFAVLAAGAERRHRRPSARPLVMVAVVGAAAAINIRGLKGGARAGRDGDGASSSCRSPASSCSARSRCARRTWSGRDAAGVGRVCDRRPHHPGLSSASRAPCSRAARCARRSAPCPERRSPPWGRWSCLYIVGAARGAGAAGPGAGRRVGGAAGDRGRVGLRPAGAHGRCWRAAAASMFGNLSGSILAGPRGLFALGRDGFLPGVPGAGAPVRRTPHVASSSTSSCRWGSA